MLRFPQCWPHCVSFHLCPHPMALHPDFPSSPFRVDYVRADGDLSTYTPDFLVRTTDGTVWIVETKGREERDLPQKMARLAAWCADASAADPTTRYDFVFVDQKGFEKHPPSSFAGLAAAFTEFKP